MCAKSRSRPFKKQIMQLSVCTVLLSLVLNASGNLPLGAGDARNDLQDYGSGRINGRSDDQKEYGGTYPRKYGSNHQYSQDGEEEPGLEQRGGSYSQGFASGKHKRQCMSGASGGKGGALQGGLQEQLSGLLQNLGPLLQGVNAGGSGGKGGALQGGLQGQLSGLLQNLGPLLQGLTSGGSGGKGGGLQEQLSGLLQNLGPVLQGLTSGGSGGKGGALQGQLSGLLQNLGPLLQGLNPGGTGGKRGALQGGPQGQLSGLLQNLGSLGQGLTSGGSEGRGGNLRGGQQRSCSTRQGVMPGGCESRGRKGSPRGGFQGDDVMGNRKCGK